MVFIEYLPLTVEEAANKGGVNTTPLTPGSPASPTSEVVREGSGGAILHPVKEELDEEEVKLCLHLLSHQKFGFFPKQGKGACPIFSGCAVR